MGRKEDELMHAHIGNVMKPNWSYQDLLIYFRKKTIPCLFFLTGLVLLISFQNWPGSHDWYYFSFFQPGKPEVIAKWESNNDIIYMGPHIYRLLFIFLVLIELKKRNGWLNFPQSCYWMLLVIIFEVLVVFKVIRTLEQINTKWALIFEVIFSN